MKLGELLATATAIVLPVAATLWAAAKGREEEKEEEEEPPDDGEFVVTIE